MKALKIIGIVLGSIVGLVVIIVGVIWFLMSRTTGIAAEMTEVTASTQAAAELDTKMADFRSEVSAAAVGSTVSVTMTEEEVTSKIAEELKTVELPAGLSLGDVSVNLKDGKLLLSADMKYSVFSGNAGMEAEVKEVDGKASILVDDVDFGSLPIPQSLKDQLKGMIPANGVIALEDLPFDISSIQIVDGQMVIAGVKQ
ncbi:MAG: hypothetical protein PHE50_07860 [Dehalococcoidales bacterium]|nr:hypothetical protein [Dehalococcoidales bacterium]